MKLRLKDVSNRYSTIFSWGRGREGIQYKEYPEIDLFKYNLSELLGHFTGSPSSAVEETVVVYTVVGLLK